MPNNLDLSKLSEQSLANLVLASLPPEIRERDGSLSPWNEAIDKIVAKAREAIQTLEF
jgi:hypothetical protein